MKQKEIMALADALARIEPTDRDADKVSKLTWDSTVCSISEVVETFNRTVKASDFSILARYDSYKNRVKC